MLERASPESQGIDPRAIESWLNAVAGDELHSLVLMRHGKVVAEGAWSPFALPVPHQMWSLSKSFTSTAMGMAVGEGRLKLTDRVVSFFPDHLPPEVSENLAAMTVRDLLIMGTGHETEPPHGGPVANGADWRSSFLAHPVPYVPGTHFLYNSSATYMVSAILHQLTGQRLLDYLTPRLFAPLGIEGATWLQDPNGIDAGGWGLFVRTEDIARFAQFCLQRGEWAGQTLVSVDWIDEATASQIDNSPERDGDWAQGYGYQFWRCRPSGVYRGDGAFGQYAVVMPEQDAVLAITGAVLDMGAILEATWTHLLPAMGPSPLPASSAGPALASRLDHLALTVPTHTKPAPMDGRREFRFGENEDQLVAMEFTWAADRDHVVWRRGNDVWEFAIGHGEWASSTCFDSQVVAVGGWTAPDRYEFRLRWLTWGSGEDVTVQVNDDASIAVRRVRRGSFGPSEAEALTACPVS